MHPDTMRFIDRWAGIPLCFFTSLLIWKNKKTGIGAESNDTIVFIGIAEIGALVVAYPAIQEARKQHPQSRICFITAPAGKQTLELMGFEEKDILLIRTSSIQNILGDIVKIRNVFKKVRVSAVVLEPFTRFSTLVATWIGASKRLGCHRFLAEGVYLGNLLTHRLVYNPHLHASQTYFALAKLLEEPESVEPTLKEVVASQIKNRLKIEIPENEHQILKQRLQGEISDFSFKKIVLLNANASDIVPLRKWSLSNFVELGKRLLENAEITVVLTGSPEENEACADLALKIDPDRVINFAGKTTFKELITLYSLSDLLVTNDSGPVHFASTTDIPIIALFGPETPKIFGPMSPHAKTISLGLACSPCISVFNQKKSSCTDNQCMKQITVEMVIQETQKILRK
ncbi:MAG: glycosyltransferase family 9 protein [Deltaproteobacteria bacterium]|jgi:lipopolysaccharide heptosyltransferase II|nr:glycosyltransferase family 9 protein [Deltaproteobacteria bacterium]MBT5175627.1 glycosyltransferase family 9 protein [Candidatus Neomarinimicrobiota bacterium]